MEQTETEVIIEAQPGLRFVDWREVKEFKDLLYFLVLRDIKVLYHQTVLGFGWAILRPLLGMIVFTVIFGKLAKLPSDGIPYPIFSYSALIPWTYFSSTLTSSTQSLVTQANIFTKVYFPRIFIPLTSVFAKLVDFAIAFGLLVFIMIYYGYAPTIKILLLPPLIVMLLLTASGMAMWLSALAINYRDVKHAVEFLAQLLMYSAPVVWPASLIPSKYRILYGFYPMAGIIEGFRSAIIGTRSIPWDLVITGSVGAVILFISGALYFKQTERYFADIA